MRHFQADDSHADAFAGHSLLDGFGHLFGEDHHGTDFVVSQVEDVVILTLGNHQCVTLHHGIDVQKSEETLVFSDFVAGNFALYDS